MPDVARKRNGESLEFIRKGFEENVRFQPMRTVSFWCGAGASSGLSRWDKMPSRRTGQGSSPSKKQHTSCTATRIAQSADISLFT